MSEAKKTKEIGNKEKKQKGNKSKKKKVLIILGVIVLILALIIGMWAYRAKKLGGGLQGLIAATMGHNENTKKNLDAITFLALGKSQNLTDTLMVCSYDPKTQTAVMLSIPRDTFTGTNQNKATASQKINALYQISPQRTLDAVNKITGLNIKYYAMIDTVSLKKVVDAIGGVYFTVPMDMKYDDPSQKLYIDLKEGYQLLNGDKAEQLVRFRHGNNSSQTYSSEYGEQDLGRMRTQREFLVTAAKQILQPQNIFKIGEFIEIAHKHLETNIPLDVIKDYIPYAIEFNTENVKSEMLPGEPKQCNGVWLYIQNEKETKQIVQELFGDKTETQTQAVDASNLKIEVLNGSGNKQNLEKVTNLLKENGYTISTTGTTKSTSKTTIINRTAQTEETEENLKSILKTENINKGTDTKKGVDFTVIIGKDCKLE